MKTKDIRIRDPFIYTDRQKGTYYMYAQSTNRVDSEFIGVETYASQDLLNWTAPQPVLTLTNDAGVQSVWAPEVHEYKGKYYLFVTLTFGRMLAQRPPVEGQDWPQMCVRGTHVFHAHSPAGPFQPLKEASHTPGDWMALDGTLHVEDGTPYMVFCHEWVQMIDGTIDYVQLRDDLTDTVGKPQVMFRASSAPGALQSPDAGKVTDGCFLYRSPLSDRLFMIWSTFTLGSGYSVVLTHSESGGISGPWKQQTIMFSKDGGHGMLFQSLDDRLMMALHQPNDGGRERLRVYAVNDTGATLTLHGEAR
jgi:hypothetical protein